MPPENLSKGKPAERQGCKAKGLRRAFVKTARLPELNFKSTGLGR